MAFKKISEGVVHTLPADVKASLVQAPKSLTIWEDLTPLSRNEWICWITSAKKDETRKIRIDGMHSRLMQGKRRPCCWPGCPHRKKGK